VIRLTDDRGERHEGIHPELVLASIAVANLVTREHAVPCSRCGVNPVTLEPRSMTWNISGICKKHDVE
jgi:hypothetical protein